MISRVLLAIGFLIIWFLAILPITPMIYDAIISAIDNSDVPLEFSYTVKYPKTVYDNSTNTTKVVWVEEPRVINFKPAIYILLLIVLYLAPPFVALKIMIKRRW